MNQVDGSSSQMFLGKYKIVSKLGQGAMGMVYKGFDPSIERYVALKTVSSHILNMDDSSMASSLERFKQEAKIAGRLNHPNIVSVYDFGENQKTIFIAMEFVEGQELKQMLQEQTSTPDLSITIRMMSQLLEALQHAHDKGIVHRDIKPGNIIITKNGDIKVTDFGIAKIDSSELTQMGTLLGTPSYMSPEMVNGNDVDTRSDIFSAGVVFYQCLTGRKPFGGPPHQAMNKIINQPHIPPSKIVSGLCHELDRIMDRALAKDPDQRYATALAMLDDLRMLTQRNMHPNEPTVAIQNPVPPVEQPHVVQENPFPALQQEAAPKGPPEPDSGGSSFSWPLMLSLMLLIVAVMGAVFVYYDRFHTLSSGDVITQRETEDNQVPITTTQPDPVQPESVNPPQPVPLALITGQERIEILRKVLETSKNALSMPVLRDLLKLKIAVQIALQGVQSDHQTETFGGGFALSINALENRIARINRVVQVSQGHADLICTLEKNGGPAVLFFKNRFLKNAPDASFPLDDLLGDGEGQVTLESVINKLYALNVFDLMQRLNPSGGSDYSYIEFPGVQDDIFHIGKITNICVHSDQTAELVLLNINSMDITMLSPHFRDQGTYIQAGRAKCTGKTKIYPPAGTEMMVAFFLKNSELLDKFGYTLSKETGFSSWPYVQDQAYEFCENLMFRMLSSVNADWHVDTRIVQVKN